MNNATAIVSSPAAITSEHADTIIDVTDADIVGRVWVDTTPDFCLSAAVLLACSDDADLADIYPHGVAPAADCMARA